MVRLVYIGCAAAVGALIAAGPAGAAETVTYSYDALGRLVTVARTGTVNDGATTAYVYDKADNRITKTVTGAPSRLIVVPLDDGFVVIPTGPN